MAAGGARPYGTGMATATLSPLFDFSDPARDGGFTPIGDAVMGGRSRGRASAARGVLRFDGVVSLENGGGFASIRSAPAAFDLSGAAGIALRVRGDGRRYRLALRAGDTPDDASWQAAFETATGGWEVILLPLALFAPVRRGRPAPEAGSLRPDRIRTVGFLVGEGQEGPFALEISAVAGWSPADGAVALPRPAAP